MPRPKNAVPNKLAHLSGQDRVFLDGKYYYLGLSGSEEAQAKYDSLVAIYLANGRKVPEGVPTHQADTAPTVAHVTAAFRRNLDTKYVNSPDEGRPYRKLCDELDDYFGDIEAEKFGPLKLESFRELLEASGTIRRK